MPAQLSVAYPVALDELLAPPQLVRPPLGGGAVWGVDVEGPYVWAKDGSANATALASKACLSITISA
jgi:hypothetical protein